MSNIISYKHKYRLISKKFPFATRNTNLILSRQINAISSILTTKLPKHSNLFILSQDSQFLMF